MPELLVVVGATGTQGASVIRHVQQRIPSLAIRGLTRNTTSPAAKALQSQGIEVVEADPDDSASLTSAFHGATAIFALTDYWAPYIAHATSGRPDAWTAARADELRRGRALVDAAAATLAEGTLQHFIFSSLPSPEAITRGRVSELHHYEGKVDVVKYIRGLKPVDGKAGGNGKSLGDVTTLVWAGYYMENFARWDLNAYLRPRKDADGSYTISTPSAPSTPITLLSASHDFGAFVAPILASPPQGIDDAPPVLAASATATFPEICAALSKRMGVEIRYRRNTPAEMEKEWGDFGRHFATMYRFYDEFGFAGDEPMRGGAELGIDQGKLTKFEEFAAEKEWDGFLVIDEEREAK